ncbi:hypothetical protein [Microbacterium azadirachtae]|uniref:Uncharacterized protein n=1 Tax=Microbacterium azadirachtae TaxID=582680 RepID=A0A1I6HG33_9MICO|nr:hypothetical protein [Microbacterium azadirachtae]SFR53453.1 hypothetical protein SAMN04488591_1808 [Microbacterium azadirachtae]
MNSTPDPSTTSGTTEDLSIYSARRQRRIRITAWVVIVALILVGGGSTVLTVLLG